MNIDRCDFNINKESNHPMSKKKNDCEQTDGYVYQPDWKLIILGNE